MHRQGLLVAALALAGCVNPGPCPGGAHSIDPDGLASHYEIQVLDAVALKHEADSFGRIHLAALGHAYNFTLTGGGYPYHGADGNVTASLGLSGVWADGWIDTPSGRIEFEGINGCDPATASRTVFYWRADARPISGPSGEADT